MIRIEINKGKIKLKTDGDEMTVVAEGIMLINKLKNTIKKALFDNGKKTYKLFNEITYMFCADKIVEEILQHFSNPLATMEANELLREYNQNQEDKK